MQGKLTKKVIVSTIVSVMLLGSSLMANATQSYYRVRLDWSNVKSQIGAFQVLDNAMALADANPGYEVYDENGNVVYAGSSAVVEEKEETTKETTVENKVEVKEEKKEVEKVNERPIEKSEEGPVTEVVSVATDNSDTFILTSPTKKYITAGNAASNTSPVGSYGPGSYYIYKEYNGMLNISKVKGRPGAWVNVEKTPNNIEEKVESTVEKTTTTVEKTTTTKEGEKIEEKSSPTTVGENYKLLGSTYKYANAGDAMAKVNALGSYGSGSYYIYKEYNGMINITKTPGVPGAWINPNGSSSEGATKATETKQATTQETTKATSTSSTTGDKVVAAAKSVLGTPYVWGGESLAEGGFDCSGLAYWAYKQAGINIPRTSTSQYNAMTKVSSPEPGDLVIYGYGGDIVHTGIYIGNGQIIHSPDVGDVVRVANAQMYSLSTIGYVRAR